MSEELGNIIAVDFKKKVKIDSFQKYIWKCAICNEKYEHDSRKTNTGYVSGAKNMKICQFCCVDIYGLVIDNDWNKTNTKGVTTDE